MSTRDLHDAVPAPPEATGPADDTVGGTAEPVTPEPQSDESPPADTEDRTPAADDDELAQLRAERDEHLDGLRRVSADFANFRRRATDREAAAVRRAEETLLRTLLLPVLDTLDAAHAHHRDALDPVWRASLGELERAGLERLDPLGKPFDPAEHDALAVDGDGDGAGTVAAVLRAGYRWRGQLLRPAQVHVHRGTETAAGHETAPVPDGDVHDAEEQK